MLSSYALETVLQSHDSPSASDLNLNNTHHQLHNKAVHTPSA